MSWATTGFVLLLAGLVVGRPQVTAAGVPLVLSVVWGWLCRPVDPTDVTLPVPRYRLNPGKIGGELRIHPPVGVATTLVRVGSPGYRPVDIFLASSRPRSVDLAVNGVRTGRRKVFSVAYLQAGLGLVVRSEPQTIEPVEVTVLPPTSRLKYLPLPFRLQGLAGAHDSHRNGDGGDFRDISHFAPGHRVRRIDWRVTARRAAQDRRSPAGDLSRLYIRRSHATADAVVILGIDSRDDIGPDVATWAGGKPVHPDDATSLDIARWAAASMARRYLEIGDRVGVIDLGPSWRFLRPASGPRHLQRLLHQLAGANPDGQSHPRVRAPQLPSGALVVLFSTFLDDDATDLAKMWSGSGHRVTAIDVTPAPRVDHLPAQERRAYRVVELERENRLWSLARTGVGVIRWQGDATAHWRTSLDTPFAALARQWHGHR